MTPLAKATMIRTTERPPRTPIIACVGLMHFTEGTAELYLAIYSVSIFLVIGLLSSWFSGFLLQGRPGGAAGGGVGVSG